MDVGQHEVDGDRLQELDRLAAVLRLADDGEWQRRGAVIEKFAQAAVVESAGAVAPALILALALLWVAAPWIARQPYRVGAIAIVGIALTSINMFGGFAVTRRMLAMFRK